MKNLEGEAWLHSKQKRAIDIGVVSATSPVTLPILGMASLAIGIGDRVPPLFRQERTGLYPDTLKIPKLRTLRGPVDNGMSPNGYKHHRATKIGEIVRRTHVDEFPQLGLVLGGKMSLVGPRPIVLDEFEQTMDALSPSEQRDWEWARRISKPGLLSLFDIRRRVLQGHSTFVDRANDDIEYAATASFATDLGIMGKTLKAGALSMLRVEANEPYKHVHGVGMMTNLARLYGVEVTAEDQTYWRAMMNATYVLDALVDDAGVRDIEQVVRQMADGVVVEGINEPSARELSQVFNSLSPEKQSILMECDLGTFSDTQATAATFDDYLVSNLAESRVFADILSLPNDESKPDFAAREAFNNWLQLFSRAAYVLDNLVDNGKDYKAGLSPLVPGLRTNVLLARAAYNEVMRWSAETPLIAYPIIAKKIAGRHIPRILKA